MPPVDTKRSVANSNNTSSHEAPISHLPRAGRAPGGAGASAAGARRRRSGSSGHRLSRCRPGHVHRHVRRAPRRRSPRGPGPAGREAGADRGRPRRCREVDGQPRGHPRRGLRPRHRGRLGLVHDVRPHQQRHPGHRRRARRPAVGLCPWHPPGRARGRRPVHRLHGRLRQRRERGPAPPLRDAPSRRHRLQPLRHAADGTARDRQPRRRRERRLGGGGRQRSGDSLGVRRGLHGRGLRHLHPRGQPG